MGRMPRLVERGKKDRRLGEPREVSWEEIEALELEPRVDDPSPRWPSLESYRAEAVRHRRDLEIPEQLAQLSVVQRLPAPLGEHQRLPARERPGGPSSV